MSDTVKRDYYEILGVEKSANDDDLKKAYRKLAVQHHPDKNPGDKASEDKFKEVNEAYQILSDPQKRSAYDRFGHAGVGGAGFNPGYSNFSDIFDNIFSDIFGGGTPASQGIDLRYNLEITFEEAAFGATTSISFERESACGTCAGSGAKAGTKPVPCRTCRGTGRSDSCQGFNYADRSCHSCLGRGLLVEQKCTDCRGRGRTKRPATLSVTIPAGIDDDQRLRIRGEGESADPGARAGDLYVHVHVKPHPLFQREGEHVILDFPVTFSQAALGGEIEIPTLAGKSSMKVSAGLQSGEVIRLKGKGIKRLNGSGSGDQLVRIFVETPKNLTSKQKQLLQQFEKEGTGETHPVLTNFLKKMKEILKS